MNRVVSDRFVLGKEIDSEKGDSNAATVIQRNKKRRPAGRGLRRLKLNYLRGANVLARANFAEQLFARGVVEIQHRKRGTASLISAE